MCMVNIYLHESISYTLFGVVFDSKLCCWGRGWVGFVFTCFKYFFLFFFVDFLKKYCLSLMSFVYFPYGEHINSALFI